MDRAQKEAVVAELGQIFADSGVVVVAHYEGLSVAEMTDFRNRMRNAGGGVRVRCLDEAEHLALILIHPVMLVVDAVLALHAYVRLEDR